MGKLFCGKCGEERAIPKCCNNQEMRSQAANLICNFCGIITYTPYHCGQRMIVKG
ncbi:MAG TPA: hypothetical protein VJI13_00725 [Candidatus Norongarragalinales archaeon]|nr:hypothetical protein [Candidatus Norongarragalinales archaeon]